MVGGVVAGVTAVPEMLVKVSVAVTDAGVAKLKKHKALTNLFLDDNPKITDAALESIQMMSKLESVSVRNTGVTPKGIAALQKARPDVKISFKELQAIRKENLGN